MKKHFQALINLIAAWRVVFGMFMIDRDGRIGVCDFGGQKHWYVYSPDFEDYVKDECSGRDINRPVVHCSIKKIKDADEFLELREKSLNHFFIGSGGKIMAEALA